MTGGGGGGGGVDDETLLHTVNDLNTSRYYFVFCFCSFYKPIRDDKHSNIQYSKIKDK